MQGAVWLRNRMLVRWMFELVEAEGDDGVSLPELVGAASRIPDERGKIRSSKTVDNTIGDMAAFGLVRKVRRSPDVFVVATVLGVAWWNRVLLPELEAGGVLEVAVLELPGYDAVGEVEGLTVDVEECVNCGHDAAVHLSSGGCGACACRRLAVL